MIMNERILITGANGFIGSNIIAELLANNTPITAIVRNKSNTEVLKKIKCYNVISTDNYLDATLIRKLSMSKPKFIIHCAWDKNSLTNTRNMLNILEMAKQIDCKNFITLGTFEEYGDNKKNINELAVCAPKSNFGKIKYAHYLLAKELCASLNINHIHVRLGIPYSNKNNANFFFTNIINSLSKNEPVILDSLLDSKDYVHTSDIARGLSALISNDLSGLYNLSFGQAIEVKSVLNMIYEKLNKKFYYNEQETLNKVIFNLSINKISSDTNWKPTISIWDGIALLIQETKFKNRPSLEEFAKRIRSLY